MCCEIQTLGTAGWSFSDTIRDFIKHGEGVYSNDALIPSCSMNTHTACTAVRQTPEKTLRHIHSEPTAEQNEYGYEYCIALEHEKSIMTRYSLLSMKYYHLSVLISSSLWRWGGFSLCISAWRVCDSLFSFHSCHLLINKTHTEKPWWLIHVVSVCWSEIREHTADT